MKKLFGCVGPEFREQVIGYHILTFLFSQIQYSDDNQYSVCSQNYVLWSFWGYQYSIIEIQNAIIEIIVHIVFGLLIFRSIVIIEFTLGVLPTITLDIEYHWELKLLINFWFTEGT